MTAGKGLGAMLVNASYSLLGRRSRTWGFYVDMTG